MSTNRSSSGVRELRAMFENQAAEANEGSPNGRLSGGSPELRKGKITSNFVPVDGQANHSAPGASNGDAAQTTKSAENTVELSKEASTTANVPSTSATSQEATNGVHKDADTKTTPSKGVNTSAAASYQSPTASSEVKSMTNGGFEATKSMSPAAKQNEAANPDKPVSGAEIEVGPLQPADVTSAAATTPAKLDVAPGAQGSSSKPDSNVRSPVASKDSAAPQATPSKSASKPSLINTPGKTLSTAEAKVSTPRSPRTPSATQSKNVGSPQKAVTSPKVASRSDRSSLTAQTASSAAKSKHNDKEAGVQRKTQDIKAKAKSPAKAVKQMSAHLLAPTASSAARQENSKPTEKSSTSSIRSSLGSAKPSAKFAPAKPSCFGRSNSTATKPTAKSSIGATGASRPATSSEGLLSRLTRPTASSAGKSHEKPEISKSTSTTAATHKASLPFRTRAQQSGSDVRTKSSETARTTDAKSTDGAVIPSSTT